MTPDEFKGARHVLGLSLSQCAEAFQVTERNIRRWEKGERDIPGPARVLMRWLVYGECPVD